MSDEEDEGPLEDARKWFNGLESTVKMNIIVTNYQMFLSMQDQRGLKHAHELSNLRRSSARDLDKLRHENQVLTNIITKIHGPSNTSKDPEEIEELVDGEEIKGPVDETEETETVEGPDISDLDKNSTNYDKNLCFRLAYFLQKNQCNYSLKDLISYMEQYDVPANRTTNVINKTFKGLKSLRTMVQEQIKSSNEILGSSSSSPKGSRASRNGSSKSSRSSKKISESGDGDGDGDAIMEKTIKLVDSAKNFNENFPNMFSR